MKIAYYIVFVLLGIQIAAQPIITAAQDNQTGDYTYYHTDISLSNLDAGSSGANVTWDFSQYIPGSTTTKQIIYNCPGGNNNCSTFPEANKLINVGAESYNYMKFTNTELLSLGSKQTSSGMTTIYTYDNPKLEQKYPMTYLDSYTDTWSSYSTPAQSTETGSETVTNDAYGTLKTALGTFSNTLRTKRIMNITTTINGGTVMNVISESYSWASSDFSGALLLITFNDVIIEGIKTHTQTLTMGNNPPRLSTKELNIDDGKTVDIYPNPSSDFIHLTSKNPITNVTVLNTDGSLILDTKETTKINITNLPPGTYILKVELKDKKTVSKKFLKK